MNLFELHRYFRQGIDPSCFLAPFLFFFFLCCCSILDAAPLPSLQDQYKQAKFFYKQLETNTDLGKQRELWLKSGGKFRKVYLQNPKSELAPASLFMLGRVYLQLLDRFKKKEDLAEAISYFNDVVHLFPNHRLADDSLLILGKVSLHKMKDPEQAARYYHQILSRYPSGDMHPEAVAQLKKLSSEFNIPLPDEMIGDLNHTTLTNVLPVKYWSSPNYSRVIIKASGATTYSAQLLEKLDDKPRRLFIDFQNSYIEPRYRTPVPIADGLLQQIRSGQYSDDTVRVVLDMESVNTYKIFSLPDPFRVVIDIRGESISSQEEKHSKHLNNIGTPRILPEQIIVLNEQKKRKVRDIGNQRYPADEPISSTQPASNLTLAQQLGLGVKTIVIDPGHGGKDPGAIGNGIKEKDIVLTSCSKTCRRPAR